MCCNYVNFLFCVSIVCWRLPADSIDPRALMALVTDRGLCKMKILPFVILAKYHSPVGCFGASQLEHTTCFLNVSNRAHNSFSDVPN